MVDIDGLELSPALRELVGKVRPDDPYIAGVRVGQYQPRVVRLVFDLKQPVAPQQFTLAPVAAYQHRLVFDLYPMRGGRPAAGADPRASEQRRAARAAQAVQDALGELIARVDSRPPSAPRRRAGAAVARRRGDAPAGIGGRPTAVAERPAAAGRAAASDAAASTA